jgi:hypothetical protein
MCDLQGWPVEELRRKFRPETSGSGTGWYARAEICGIHHRRGSDGRRFCVLSRAFIVDASEAGVGDRRAAPMGTTSAAIISSAERSTDILFEHGESEGSPVGFSAPHWLLA